MGKRKDRKITVSLAADLADRVDEHEQDWERELYSSYYANLSEEAKFEAAGWRQIGAPFLPY
jgi:hypothetical protein